MHTGTLAIDQNVALTTGYLHINSFTKTHLGSLSFLALKKSEKKKIKTIATACSKCLN